MQLHDESPGSTAGRLRLFGRMALALGLLPACPAAAQVVLDGSLGPSGTLTGPAYDITADLGTRRGDNLFHSFSRFDIPSGESATFSGPEGIRNILGRVTSGQPSSLDGTVRSTVPGANLFLVNPAGVMIGPGAAVDVSGSFAVSSANYLQLGDGARFVAALDGDDSTLGTAPVVAFGFLEGASGIVGVSGEVTVPDGSSISAVGSSVVVSDGARLVAPTGSVSLTGVGFPAEVPVSVASGVAPAAPPAPGPAQAGIVIRGGRLVVDSAQVTASAPGADVDVVASESVEVLNGGQILTLAAGTDPGGDVSVKAPAIRVDGFDGALPTRIAAETISEEQTAVGGDVRLTTGLLEVIRGAEVSVSTFGAGNAGQVSIVASEIRIEGSEAPQLPTQIAANAAPVIGATSGSGGLIDIRADRVEVAGGATISASTFGDSPAGSIVIRSGELVLRNGGVSTFTAGNGRGGEIRVESGSVLLDGPFSSIIALTTGFGEGGVMDLKADSLTLVNGGGISASTFGDGPGGSILIRAGSILMDAALPEFGGIPGITAASQPSFFGEGTGGKGGDITVEAGRLEMRNGMPISTSTQTMADGGSVSVKAGTIHLDSGATIQSGSTSAGRAGTISVRATGEILLTGRSAVSTSAPESSGGDIEVRADGSLRLIDGRITAQAGPGGGGSIAVSAPRLVYLLDGTLTAQAAGDGGNLTVSDTTFFVLNRSGLISKSTTANGGNITILSDFFFESASTIDASAPFGIPGVVQVSAPNVDLSGSLVGLPSGFLALETELRPDCGVRLSGNISSFIVLGRGGLPPEPGGFIPSGPPPVQP